jgi:hypothetical protein
MAIRANQSAGVFPRIRGHHRTARGIDMTESDNTMHFPASAFRATPRKVGDAGNEGAARRIGVVEARHVDRYSRADRDAQTTKYKWGS